MSNQYLMKKTSYNLHVPGWLASCVWCQISWFCVYMSLLVLMSHNNLFSKLCECSTAISRYQCFSFTCYRRFSFPRLRLRRFLSYHYFSFPHLRVLFLPNVTVTFLYRVIAISPAPEVAFLIFHSQKLPNHHQHFRLPIAFTPISWWFCYFNFPETVPILTWVQNYDYSTRNSKSERNLDPKTKLEAESKLWFCHERCRAWLHQFWPLFENSFLSFYWMDRLKSIFLC